MQSPGSQFALADRLGADLYRVNAFRVTGLAAAASEREIGRHIEKLKMASRLGAVTPHVTKLAPLPEAPRLEAVMEAAQRLRDPEARLVDRFFWFWGGETDDQAQALRLLEQGRHDEAVEAWRRASANGGDPIASHNHAVLLHMMASDLEHVASTSPLTPAEDDRRARLWQEAHIAWQSVYELEEFWALWARITTDDSTLGAAIASRFRPGLAEALLSINAQLAIAAVRNGHEPRAIVHAALLNESRFGAGSVEQARRRALKPLVHAVTSLRTQCDAQVQGQPSLGRDAVAQLLTDSAGAVRAVAMLVPHGHPQLLDIGDSVLESAQDGLVAYANETEDWERVVLLLRQCSNIAVHAVNRERLDQNLKTALGNLVAASAEPKPGRSAAQAVDEVSRVGAIILDVSRLGQLPLAASVELCDIVARTAYGISVDLFDSGDMAGATKALQLALSLVKDESARARIEEGLKAVEWRDFEESSQKAYQTRKDGESFRNRVVGWVFGSLVAVVILASAFSSSKGRSTSIPATRSSTSGAQRERIPQAAPIPPTKPGIPVSELFPAVPAISRAGRQGQLDQLETEINQAKAVIAQHEQAVEQLDLSLERTESEIEGYKDAIEQLEQASQAGLDADRSRYEWLIATHNETVKRHNETVALRRAKFAEYQAALRDGNAKVNAYNSLIR